MGETQTASRFIFRPTSHSEPTVEIRHPLESEIFPNEEFDYNSETEEVCLPIDFDDDPTVEMERPK